MTNYSNQVSKNNPVDVVFRDTDFYKYLKGGGYTDVRINDIIEYLKGYKFRPGQDSVSESTLCTLRIIYQAYFDNEVKS